MTKLADTKFESKREEREHYQMTVKQLAKRIGWQADALLDALRAQNYKIPSADTNIGGLITRPLIQEYDLNGSVKLRPVDVAPTKRRKKVVKLNSSYKDGHEFEAAVGDFISRRLPNSHLSNVFLFLAERLSTTDKYGREIDHLLHMRRGTQHRLVIVECKHSNLELEGRSNIKQEKDWIIETTAGRKEVREQMWIQARALLQLLKPIPEVDLVVEAIALVSGENTESIYDTSGKDDPRVQYRVMGFDDLGGYLDEMSRSFEFFRVGQSEFLRRLRQGMRCSQLGHPDIRDAIDYHRRSRQTLDYGLFQHFKPTQGKWAINGTAGMGKSVLLAYALCAFSTDHQLVLRKNGELQLVAVDLQRQKLPPLQQRKIVVFSLKEKQRRIIEHFWKHLIDDFQAYDHENVLQIQRPNIRRWQLGEEIDGNVVLIDEAHDLSDEAQNKITSWLNEDPDSRYLVIACDRHQKLRLIGDSNHQRMIAGLHFGRHTKALKRVYRNPFSVYAAGLGLMFRWFAPDGPKVVPDQVQLKKDFGFKVNKRSDEQGGACEFEMTEDAHPGNHWHHCVSNFPDAETAHHWLGQYQLGHEEVLWVRFDDEEPDFDYEQLQQFQYHNLNSNESANIIDKYIKGQEFPVVVIEGVGDQFNNYENEEAMFAHRRELYLCASRATVFLFFIYSGAEGGAGSVNQELENLRRQLSLPIQESKSSQRWGLEFEVVDKAIPLSQFEDLVDPLDSLQDEEEAESEEVDDVTVVTPEEVAPNVEVKTTDADTEPLSSPAPEVRTASLEERTIEVFAEQFDTSKMKPSIDGLPYTPIDYYTPEIFAHYLGVDLKKLNSLLVEFDNEVTPDCRLHYTIIAKIAKVLGVAEPWNHPTHASKPEKLKVQYHGQHLTVSNLVEHLSGDLGQGKVSAEQAKSVLSEVLRDTGKSSRGVLLLELLQVVKHLELDGDLFLESVRPYHEPLTKESKPTGRNLPYNPSGYSVLQSYTPRSLAVYLDVKPFKVMAELMKIPKVMNLTLNQEITLETVERTCASFGRMAPWSDPKHGNAVSDVRIEFGDKVVTTQNFLKLVKSSYRKLPDPKLILSAVKKVQSISKSEGARAAHLSATDVYELLKLMKLRPEAMLEHLKASSRHD